MPLLGWRVGNGGGNGTEPHMDAMDLENRMTVLGRAVLPLLVCLHGGLPWLVWVLSLRFFGHTSSSHRRSHRETLLLPDV